MRFEQLAKSDRVEIRPYQMDVIKECFERFMGSYKDRSGRAVAAHKSVLVESPTGSGKTIMGLLTAKALQQIDPDLVVVWEAMRKPLLAQAIKSNDEMVGVENFHAVSMFSNNPTAILKAKENGKMVLHICDEAQHSTASSSAHLHNVIKPDFVLGLSATPYRTDNQKLCFEGVVRNAGIHALIDAGYLSKYEHFTIPEYNSKSVLEHYLRDPARWGKSIFYFLTLEECFAFSRGLLEAGVKCDVVTGDSDSDTQIQAFEDGEHNCLINCMKLTEGFDCPSLKTVWVRDSSKSPAVQMCGRVLRKFAGLPVKQVVQSQHTSHPFLKTAMADQSWVFQDGDWKSLKVNAQIEQIQANAMSAIANINVQMPSFIMKRTAKSRINTADRSSRS